MWTNLIICLALSGTSTAARPPQPNDKFHLQAKVVDKANSRHPEFDGLYMDGALVNSNFGNMILQGKSKASVVYLDKTNKQRPNGRPFYQLRSDNLNPGVTNTYVYSPYLDPSYNVFLPAIVTPGDQPQLGAFFFTDEGFLRHNQFPGQNPAVEASSFMACNWGLQIPQLFIRTGDNGRDVNAIHRVPSNCARVELVAVKV